MEASSQAIDLHRCDWLRFKVAVFANLTRDHLDYHHTMENYFDAKKRLFDGRLGEPPASSVINIDDEWGAKLVAELKDAGQRVVTFSQNADADLTANEITVSLIRGTSFHLQTPAGEREITSPLVGRPHVYNMLAATATALELGYELDSIVNGLSKCVGAPGRFERVQHDGRVRVPAGRQQMIVENVHEHAAEPAKLAADSRPAALYERMGIGERVDLFMFLSAALEGRAHPAQLLSSHDVGQQIAQAKFDVRLGKINVRQPIQAESFI